MSKPRYYKEYDEKDGQHWIMDSMDERVVAWTNNGGCASHVCEALNQYNRNEGNVIQLEAARYSERDDDGLYAVTDMYGMNRIMCWTTSDITAGFIVSAMNRLNIQGVHGEYTIHTIDDGKSPKFNSGKVTINY